MTSEIEGVDWGYSGAQARRDDFKQWEENKMTNKQQNDEKIAEWLGEPLVRCDGEMHVRNSEGFLVEAKNWLSSDSGTVAMIEKLCKVRPAYCIALAEAGNWFIKESTWYRETALPDDAVNVSGKTLNAALQAAILELLQSSDQQS